MPASLSAVLAAGLGNLPAPELAAGLGLIAGLALLPSVRRGLRTRRYGDVAVGLVVAALAALVVVRCADGLELTAAAAVVLIACAAGSTFGRAAAVWASALVALRYAADPTGPFEEPWLVAWTGAWMAVAAPRVRDRRSAERAVVAAGAPLLVAAAIAFGGWDVPLDLAVAIVAALALLPASAILGAALPSEVARAAGVAAVAVLAFSLLSSGGDGAAERSRDELGERSGVADLTDDTGRAGRR